MQLNTLTIALIAATLINGVLALLAWRRRPARASIDLFLLLLAITFWCLFAALEGISTELFYKILFSVLAYMGTVTVPVLFLLFTSRYVNLDKLITNRNIVLLFLIPATTLILAATNQLHGLLWTDISLNYNEIAGIYGMYSHGPWYWVNIFYSYCKHLQLPFLLRQISAEHLSLPSLFRQCRHS